jgi:hypothetical protein
VTSHEPQVPSSFKKVSCSQGSHWDWPVRGCCSPGPHCWHEEARCRLENELSSHSRHCFAAEEAENRPISQLTQMVEPGERRKRRNEHELVDDALPGRSWFSPMLQAVHRVSPVALE